MSNLENRAKQQKHHFVFSEIDVIEAVNYLIITVIILVTLKHSVTLFSRA